MNKQAIEDLINSIGIEEFNEILQQINLQTGHKAISFDGTDKDENGGSTGILYHLENMMTESGRALRQEVLENASDEAREFFNDCNYDPMRTVDGASLTPEEWTSRRCDAKTRSIGASEVAIIDGTSPYSTNIDLWNEKLGNKKAVEESEEAKARKEAIFLWGHICEKYIRSTLLTHPDYKEKFAGCKILTETMIYSHFDFQHLTCNLDALLLWPDGRYSILEFKAPSKYLVDNYDNNNIPMHYQMQMQDQMLLVNIDDGYLVSMFDRDTLKVSYLMRDLDHQMEIVKMSKEFWDKHILSEIEPEIIGSGKNALDASLRWKGKGNKALPAIDLDANIYADILRKAVEFNEQKAMYTKMAKAADEQMKDALSSILFDMGQICNATCVDAINSSSYFITYNEEGGGSYSLPKANLEGLRSNDPILYQQVLPYLKEKQSHRTIRLKKVIM